MFLALPCCVVVVPDPIDATDRRILDLLGEEARSPIAEIASRVELSATAVRRRITRLEEAGVIVTYTAVLDHSRVERSLEAYIELDLAPRTDVPAFLADAVSRPEVREASTLAGQPDAILRLRVEDISHLRKVVAELRESEEVVSSKTLVALDRLRHVSKQRNVPGQTESGVESQRPSHWRGDIG